MNPPRHRLASADGVVRLATSSAGLASGAALMPTVVSTSSTQACINTPAPEAESPPVTNREVTELGTPPAGRRSALQSTAINCAGPFVAEGPLGADLFAVWLGANGAALAAGGDFADAGRRDSRLFQRVGTSWVAVPMRGDQPLRAVWATPADGGLSVWVAGPGGVILRRDP